MAFINKFRANDLNNGVYSLSGVTQYAQFRWMFPTTSPFYSSPVSDKRSNIYVGSTNGNLYALTSLGSLIWSFQTDGSIVSSPGISLSHHLHFGSCDHNFYSIALNGTYLWKYNTGGPIYSSPAYGINGTIYITSNDNKMYAFQPNGVLSYNISTNGPVYSSPAVDQSGNVYFGSLDGYFYAVSSSGSVSWKTAVNPGLGIYSSPVLPSSKQAVVYFTASDPTTYYPALYSLNTTTGSILWSSVLIKSPVPNIYTSPSILNNGNILISANAFTLLALNPTTGQPSSTTFNTKPSSTPGSSPNADNIQGSVIVGRDQTIYFIGNFLYCYVLQGTSYQPYFYATYDNSAGFINRRVLSEDSVNSVSGQWTRHQKNSVEDSISVIPSLKSIPPGRSNEEKQHDTSTSSDELSHSYLRSVDSFRYRIDMNLDIPGNRDSYIHKFSDQSISLLSQTQDHPNNILRDSTAPLNENFTITSSLLIGNDGNVYISSPDGSIYSIYNPFNSSNSRISSLLADILFVMPLIIVFVFTCVWYINYRVVTRYYQQANRQGRELTREELEQIVNVLEGQLLIRVLHANQSRRGLPAEENYLRGNWRVCKQLPNKDYDNNCVICFNPLFAQDSTHECNQPENSESRNNSENLKSARVAGDHNESGMKKSGSSGGISDNWHAKRPSVSALIDSLRSTHTPPASAPPYEGDEYTPSGESHLIPKAVELPCGHIFHEECIEAWAASHNNCPVCRYKPTKEEENFGSIDSDPDQDHSILSQRNVAYAVLEDEYDLRHTNGSSDSSQSSSSPFVANIHSTGTGIELGVIQRNDYAHVATTDGNMDMPCRGSATHG